MRSRSQRRNLAQFTRRPPAVWLLVALLAPGAAAADRLRVRDDAHVREVHRRLLEREPSAEEVADQLSAMERAGHRIAAYNLVLDSEEFARRVTDAAYLVGLYRGVRGRRPLLHEMGAGLHLLSEGMPRSEVLGSLIQPRLPVRRLTRGLTRRYDDVELDFRTAALRRYAREARGFLDLDAETLRELILAEADRLDGLHPGRELPLEIATTRGAEPDYDVFYGYLHAHTTVSLDANRPGSGDPFEAYAYARDVAGLDFLGLSDHAEFISTWPWSNEWRLLGEAADASNQDGEFVALRGFEYSNPFYGHINVFGTTEFTSTFIALTPWQFYSWLSRRPDAAATFNHPGQYDWLGAEFLHWTYFPEVRRQMVGMEMLTHGADYDTYSVGYVATDDLGFLDEAVAEGWRVASVSAQDNHAGGWGTLDEYRTGVLARSLTRADILDALRARRFFSTQDRNLAMSFRAGPHEMGSVVAGGQQRFDLTVEDADGEGVAWVVLYENGLPIESRESADEGRWSFFVDESGRRSWYYVVVTQEDGDRAMSAPIWAEPTDPRDALP